MSTDLGTEEPFNENNDHDAPPGSFDTLGGVDDPMNHPDSVGGGTTDDAGVDGGTVVDSPSVAHSGGDTSWSAPPTLDDTSEVNGARWEDESPASGPLGSDDSSGEYTDVDRDDDDDRDRDRDGGSSFKDKVQEFSEGVKARFS